MTDKANQHIAPDDIESLEENTRAYYLEQARVLGLNFSKNTPTEKLKEIVGRKLSEGRKENKSKRETIADIAKEQRALVRIRIQVLNPAKQNWTGQIFTVGNEYIPHMTRYIPFNAEGGIWHVEKMFVDFLKSRKYTVLPEKGNSVGNEKKAYGVDFHKRKEMPEFAIEILPPLTMEELEQLRAMQDANGSVQND